MIDHLQKPALWLITLIVGLPQLSETVYTPSLPTIAHALNVSEAWVEYTLTIYLLGFAVGTLLWGALSDRYGRKPCLLTGLSIYIAGCLGCCYSDSLFLLMLSRFIQALGGSAGSVLGQAICRDAFTGIERGKVYSIIGSALAFSPAIGPVLGGFITEKFSWNLIFIVLACIGLVIVAITSFTLSETHTNKSAHYSLASLFHSMIFNSKIIGYALIIGCCNGIGFSYYAEGSFYLINLLGLSPSSYGMSFILIACAGALGGYLSRSMHRYRTSLYTLRYGVHITFLSTVFFSFMTGMFHLLETSRTTSIVLTLVSIVCTMIGIGITIPNALSLSLEDYRSSIGKASALFGCFYYGLISLCTLGMGSFHNGTLFPMPFYFLGLSTLMFVVTKNILKAR